MQNILNEDFIDNYGDKFASKITNDIFTEGVTAISGKNMVSITPSKQVNFFVIKSVFRIWQEEAQKLQSPFFDYNSKEVRQAMVQFMNTLSQHIQVRKDDFEKLVNNAVKETIYLMASPVAYMEIDFQNRGVDKITDKVIENSVKYLKIHKTEISSFLENQRGEYVEDAIDALSEEFHDFDTTQAVNDELKQLSKVVPLSIGTVYTDDPELEDDFDNLFGGDENDLFGNEDDEVAEEIKEEKTPKAVNKQPKEVFEAKKTESVPKPTIKEEFEMPSQEVEQPKEILSEPEVEPKVIEEKEEEVVKENQVDFDKMDLGKVDPAPQPKVEEINLRGDRPNIKVVYQEGEPEQEEEAPATINEQFSENQPVSVAEHHESRPSGQLMKLISLNDRYMFIRELFNNEKDDFEDCLEDLESQTSFDDSVEFLINNYAKKNNWDMQSNEVKEFLKILYRRFR